MKTLKKAAAITALPFLFVPSLVSAAQEGDNYVGVQQGFFSYEESGVDTLHPTAVIGRLGRYGNEEIALEARFGMGLTEDDTNINGVDVDLEMDRIFGVYGVGHIPFGKAFSVYALAGFTKVKVTATGSYMGSTRSFSDDDNGFSFGIGAQLNLGSTLSIHGEYVNYLDGDFYDLDAIAGGVTIAF